MHEESRTVKWISSDWLHSRMADGGVQIIDTQPDVHDYILEHIPGAVYMNEKLWRCPCRSGLPACYAPTESIVHILRRIGLQDNLPTIVYSGEGRFSGQGDGLEHTMTAYSLSRFGIENVYILDGGLRAWCDQSRPVTKKYAARPESEFRSAIDEEMMVGYDEFMELRQQEDVQVFDVRPPQVYEEKGIWSKPGHIPGAINLPWRFFMDRDNAYRLKPREQLEKLVSSVKADPDMMTIVYCGTGREATNAYIVLRWIFGFRRIKLFEGSFTEWCAHEENETVVGKTPY